MGVNYTVNRFNGGQLDRRLDGGDDLPKYFTGCRTLQNMIPLVSGGARYRPGFQFAASAKYQSGNNAGFRLYSFPAKITADSEETFVLEVGHQYIRFYTNKAQILSGGLPVEVSTPYQIDSSIPRNDTDRLQMKIIGNTAIFTHPNQPPYRLTRNNASGTSWTFSAIDFSAESAYPILSDFNTTSRTLTVAFANATAWLTATAYFIGDTVSTGGKNYECVVDHVSGTFADDSDAGYWIPRKIRPTDTGVTLTASGTPFFSPTGTDEYFELTHTRQGASVQIPIDSTNSTSGEITVRDSVVVTTTGTFEADIIVEKYNEVSSNWEKVISWSIKENRNISQSISQGGITDAQYRARVANWVSDTKAYVSMETILTEVTGLVKSTGYVGTNTLNVEVIETVESSEPTDEWRESEFQPGSFLSDPDQPSCSVFFEGRLWYARGQTIYGSQVDNFDNFRYGVLATDAVRFTISSAQIDEILWMESQEDLLIGTTTKEYKVSRADEGKIISPESDPFIRAQTTYGSNLKVPAISVNDVILFNRKQQERLMELGFQFVEAKYSTIDLTRLSERIAKNKMIDAAYMLSPDSVYWATTDAGELIGMTYERVDDVVGWHKHSTHNEGFGGIRTCTVIPTVGEDELWVGVKRVFNTDGAGTPITPVTRWTIERMTRQSEMQETDVFGVRRFTRQLAVKVDSAVVNTGVFSVMTGLNHLEGQLVQVLADGAVLKPQIVSGGQINLITDADEVYTTTDRAVAGLGYTSRVEPMNLVIDTGSGKSRMSRLDSSSVIVRVEDSFGGEVGTYLAEGEETFDNRPSALTPEPYNRPFNAVTGLKSGVMKAKVSAKPGLDMGVYIQQNDPLPLTVISASFDVNISERV